MKKLVVIAFATLLATGVRAQNVDSCLIRWEDSPLRPTNPHWVWFNPDSVRVYICDGPQYLREFARKIFLVTFTYYVFPDSIAQRVDTAAYDWRVVMYPIIRQGFQKLEEKLGRFTLSPESPGGDTSLPDDKTCRVYFQNYVNIDSALDALDSLPDVDFKLGVQGSAFIGRPLGYEGIAAQARDSLLRVWPVPCSNLLHIELAIPKLPLSFYDAIGRRVNVISQRRESEILLDVSNVPSGLYHLLAGTRNFTIPIQK